ncbi:hypothetical protein IWX47DRAFT_873192 [Phyllosticta citricarpa]
MLFLFATSRFLLVLSFVRESSLSRLFLDTFFVLQRSQPERSAVTRLYVGGRGERLDMIFVTSRLIDGCRVGSKEAAYREERKEPIIASW